MATAVAESRSSSPRVVWRGLAAVGLALLLLALGGWWRFGGEHLTGPVRRVELATNPGTPVHIGFEIRSEGGGSVRLRDARVRNVSPQGPTTEVSVITAGGPIDTVIGSDLGGVELGSPHDVDVDGEPRAMVVSFVTDEPGTYEIGDVVVRYRDGFRSRGYVVNVCAIVSVGGGEGDAPDGPNPPSTCG